MPVEGEGHQCVLVRVERSSVLIGEGGKATCVHQGEKKGHQLMPVRVEEHQRMLVRGRRPPACTYDRQKDNDTHR